MPAEISLVDWTTRLVLAAVLSGMVGFEREHRQKAAGLRTHMLVGLGAALFTLLSGTAFGVGDPSRIAAQVVSGIGFLGAGAIFRWGATIRGLTTAAGMWAVAAIGMTAGAGFLVGAAAATVIVLVILIGLRLVEDHLRRRRALGNLRPVGVRLRRVDLLPELVRVVQTLDPSYGGFHTQPDGEGRFRVVFEISGDRVEGVVAGLTTLDAVEDVGELDPN
jgi:uncharacterized membrane protein YhiD involved in acid resistance